MLLLRSKYLNDSTVDKRAAMLFMKLRVPVVSPHLTTLQQVSYRIRCMPVAVAICYSFNVLLLHLLLYAGLSRRTSP